MDRPFDEMLNKRGIRRGDEESAPFIQSTRTTAVLSLLVDTGRGVVWSGHVDGRILAWRADGSGLVDGFMDCGAWDAHQRAPVLSMVLTSYGTVTSDFGGLDYLFYLPVLYENCDGVICGFEYWFVTLCYAL